jgi:hypothetical protein
MPPGEIGAQPRTASHLLSVVHATEGAEKMPPQARPTAGSRPPANGTIGAPALRRQLFGTMRGNLASKRHVGFVEADFLASAVTLIGTFKALQPNNQRIIP